MAEGLDGFGFYEMDGPAGFREIGRLPRIDPGNNVALYDFADPEKPVLVKHWKVSGNPDIAQFHKGKVVIPCGHQGVLLQK